MHRTVVETTPRTGYRFDLKVRRPDLERQEGSMGGNSGTLGHDAIDADAPHGADVTPAAVLLGTVNQVEWARVIRGQVSAEFDRVAAAFKSVAGKQSGGKRADTESIIGILEEKRAEVMSREDAGYFIHDWQEIGDQVRQMIFRDARYQVIKGNRPARQQ